MNVEPDIHLVSEQGNPDLIETWAVRTGVAIPDVRHEQIRQDRRNKTGERWHDE